MRNFGFGCMRLPMIGEEVNHEELCKMVDRFIEEGFTYFDTAHGYLNKKSEPALREALVKRYPRDAFLLVDKLTANYFETAEDVRPLIEKQLEICGVDYFDNYLIHAVTAKNYPKYVECKAFETVKQMKEEGKIKHIGLSFHDRPELLEQILIEHPELEMIQLQFNYFDIDNPSIQSMACYKMCVKYNKPVLVMEPVKGGGLVNLPEEAKKILDELNGGSCASYAIRYAASFPQVKMVLSGMSNLEQMNDNLSFMKEFVPLSANEYEAIEKVRTILKKQNLIACTACRYCTEGCPKQILIPDLFSIYNTREMNQGNAGFYYTILTGKNGKASECIECGLCENSCPQHLPIRELLKVVAKEFEK